MQLRALHLVRLCNCWIQQPLSGSSVFRTVCWPYVPKKWLSCMKWLCAHISGYKNTMFGEHGLRFSIVNQGVTVVCMYRLIMITFVCLQVHSCNCQAKDHARELKILMEDSTLKCVHAISLCHRSLTLQLCLQVQISVFGSEYHVIVAQMLLWDCRNVQIAHFLNGKSESNNIMHRALYHKLCLRQLLHVKMLTTTTMLLKFGCPATIWILVSKSAPRVDNAK